MRRLFLGAMCVIALLTKTDPQSAQEFSRLGTVESIVDRHSYQLDASTFADTIDKIYRDGHYYSHQPPLLTTMEAPVYWLLHLPGTGFNNRGRLVMTYAFSLLTNGVALALTVVVMAQILALAGVSSPSLEWLAILLPFGTWLLPYGIVSNGHGISGPLVAALAYALLVIDQRGFTAGRGFMLGGVLGLLTVIELLPVVSFVPLAAIYLLSRRDLHARGWLAVSAAFALPLIAHAIININITGDVIPAGFHHELFHYPGSAFDDSSLTGTLKYDSWRSFGYYAWQSLFAGKGYFTFAPLGLLGLIGGFAAWRWWARARGAHVVLLGGAILSMIAALATTNNFGGEAVGFRHAVYLAPAFVTMLLPWVVDGPNGMRPQTRAVIGIAALSCALMLVFAARNPWTVLLVSHASIGTWDQYVPIVGRIVRGALLTP